METTTRTFEEVESFHASERSSTDAVEGVRALVNQFMQRQPKDRKPEELAPEESIFQTHYRYLGTSLALAHDPVSHKWAAHALVTYSVTEDFVVRDEPQNELTEAATKQNDAVTNA